MDNISDIPKSHLLNVKDVNRDINRKDPQRDVNVYRHINERILETRKMHKEDGHMHQTFRKISKNRYNKRYNKEEVYSSPVSKPQVISNNTLYDYTNIEMEGGDGKYNSLGKRTSSIFLKNDMKGHYPNNDLDKISRHLLMSNNIRNLPNNILKTRRNKRYANLDSINSKSEPKYMKLNDDIAGDDFLDEDLLPFYRPTKYFLSPQLSVEHEAQSTHDKTPRGKFGTSTITINDVEKDYFASIAARSRRTTESASSSFILSKPHDGSIDESDLSSMLTLDKVTKSKKSKKTTTQTFQSLDNDKSIGTDTQIYETLNDRRPVLNLRSIDDREEDINRNANDENELVLTHKNPTKKDELIEHEETNGTPSQGLANTHAIASDNVVIVDYLPYETNKTTGENSTFYDLKINETDISLIDIEDDESVTPGYLDITGDDLGIKSSNKEDEEKRRNMVLISQILKDVEQQAIQGSNCTPGTGLNMGDIDLVGNNYKKFRGAAEVAVNRANWLTRMWKYASEVMQESEYLLHSSLFSMIESNEMIFGAGNCYDGRQYKNYSLFCPFAYKSPTVQGNILAKDLAVEYKYLKPSSTWFWTPKQRGFEMSKTLLRFETGRAIQYYSHY